MLAKISQYLSPWPRFLVPRPPLLQMSSWVSMAADFVSRIGRAILGQGADNHRRRKAVDSAEKRV